MCNTGMDLNAKRSKCRYLNIVIFFCQSLYNVFYRDRIHVVTAKFKFVPVTMYVYICIIGRVKRRFTWRHKTSISLNCKDFSTIK